MIFTPITEITPPYAFLVGVMALFWLRRVWREAQHGRRPRLAWAGAFAIFFLLLAPSLELPSLIGLSVALLVLAEWWQPAYTSTPSADSDQHWHPPVTSAWLSLAMGIFFIWQALVQVSWIDWNPQLIDLVLASGCLMILVGITNLLLGLVWSQRHPKTKQSSSSSFLLSEKLIPSQRAQDFDSVQNTSQYARKMKNSNPKTSPQTKIKRYIVDQFVWRWQTNQPLQPTVPEFGLTITHTGAKVTNETQRPLALIGWSPDNINAMLMFSDKNGKDIDILYAGQAAYLSLDFDFDSGFGFGIDSEAAEQGIRIWYCHPPTKKEQQQYQDKGEDLPPPTLRLFRANWRSAEDSQKRILN